MKTETPTNAVKDRAAEWLALEHARPLTLSEQADLADWKSSDPRHAAAYAHLAAAWARFSGLAAYPHSPDAPADPDILAPPRPHSRNARIIPISVLAAAAAIAIAAFLWLRPSPQPTGPARSVAEARIFPLSDGSIVDLNAGADVREAFTTSERRVRLVRGEAHFAVAKNPSRPFMVDAGGILIRALGTEFNVRMADQGTEVTVTEGSVDVSHDSDLGNPAPAASRARVVLRAGEGTWVSTAPSVVAPAVETIAPAEIDRRLSWQSQRVFFDDLPLEEIVARFNRRLAGRKDAPRLLIVDPGLNDLRISGRMRADDIMGFVEVLQSSFGVSVDRSSPGSLSLRASPQP